ncbi:hypothetical protein FOCG_06710 [Fusarium oxysporum f. sp. radicis-lycopersici 26381]|uniref:Uncharacterized protein n=1 Tax=Fusarium oxysporum Fo47 TaxID=660027 RepID=W9L195_FUSOX|nr:hypothetical protein FOZG_03768 [Fusarium oxysporum Fo47]EXL53398.1 hypothetical protein FOCG_06710 [Fusarium oxysporum f. sp. radicis-lycopersici 26381]
MVIGLLAIKVQNLGQWCDELHVERQKVDSGRAAVETVVEWYGSCRYYSIRKPGRGL